MIPIHPGQAQKELHRPGTNHADGSVRGQKRENPAAQRRSRIWSPILHYGRESFY